MTFNDISSTLTLLASRRSGKARDMTAPGPDEAQLRQILAAAMRVPDHGKLNPWRFIVIAPARREALADVIEAAYVAEKPQASTLEREAMRTAATMAPVLVVVLSTAREGRNIPHWEQVLSAGAACQNLLIAAHTLGFVGNWLTGWPAYAPAVVTALGGTDEDRIAGFIHLGTVVQPLEERARPDYVRVVTDW